MARFTVWFEYVVKGKRIIKSEVFEGESVDDVLKQLFKKYPKDFSGTEVKIIKGPD